MPTYLTIHEVAQRWRYNTDSPVYKLKDDIGGVKIGGKILFELEDVERYESKNKLGRRTAENVEDERPKREGE